MGERPGTRARYRAILTDTLPYEVPVIFSNDQLFLSLIRPQRAVASDVDKVVERMLSVQSEGSQPYLYCIAKDSQRETTLGVVHPTMQLSMSAFYESFSEAILSSCAKSEFTLRRPVGETSVYSESELAGDSGFKLGIVHTDPADGAVDVSHITSYFSYAKYNLLGKFYDSQEYRRLEKRFRYLRTIDVSKCFFNIYTHSVTWAIKGKSFSKQNRESFSFEAKFDRLMQACNYSETNGIVVGPEMSRIFAEIIFQDIDTSLSRSLLPKINNMHYAVRRYVDDYLVFANSTEELDSIESLIRDKLEEYKLFVNDRKKETYSRPFVSPLSRLRSAIAEEIQDLYYDADQLAEANDAKAILAIARSFARRLDAIRHASAIYSAPLSAVSGWLLSNLRNVLSSAARKASAAPRELDAANARVLAALIETIFHICSLDLRVRTTYSLCQILSCLDPIRSMPRPDLKDQIYHLIAEELAILIRGALALPPPLDTGVELSNLLISGYHYLGPDFLRAGAPGDAIERVLSGQRISYFQYITLKFCFWREKSFDVLRSLNDRVLKQLKDEGYELSNSAESYLMFCDLLSAPDLDAKQKRALYVAVFGGSPSKQAIVNAGRRLGFTDWEGLRIHHALERKALRPVYTWS